MRKTLQDEKERFRQIVEHEFNSSDKGLEVFNSKIMKLIRNRFTELMENGMKADESNDKIQKELNNVLYNVYTFRNGVNRLGIGE